MTLFNYLKLIKFTGADTPGGESKDTDAPHGTSDTTPIERETLKSWNGNKAYAAGIVKDNGAVAYLKIGESQTDKNGNVYYCVGITQKLHHATLFANKRKIYLLRAVLPLAKKDKQGRKFLDEAFPVPVVATPSVPKNKADETTF